MNIIVLATFMITTSLHTPISFTLTVQHLNAYYGSNAIERCNEHRQELLKTNAKKDNGQVIVGSCMAMGG